jgi:hypothetical protein
MIRRNPTLIAMSDLDVQDVRNLKTAEAAAKAQAVMNGKKKDDGSSASAAPGMSISSDPPRPVVAAEEERRKREAMTRNQRLGI